MFDRGTLDMNMPYDPKAKRKEDRIISSIDASYSDGTRFFNEKIIDLSLGGCQIEALTPLEKGIELTLSIASSPPVKVKGTIRWTKKKGFKYHMGVQFHSVTAEQEHQLRDIIHASFWADDKFLL